ncbi:hypothetical protein [Paenibacillus chitinolyticus]
MLLEKTNKNLNTMKSRLMMTLFLFLQNKKRKKDPPQQPLVCKGCIWDRWVVARQFCSKQIQPIRDREIIEAIKGDLRLQSGRNYIFFRLDIYNGLRVRICLILGLATSEKSHINRVEDLENKKAQENV